MNIIVIIIIIRSDISGKTITAQLVCKALNLPFIEINASDNRSQSTIEKLEMNSAYITNENQLMNKHVRKKKNSFPIIVFVIIGLNYG
jgi:hypothetical protein